MGIPPLDPDHSDDDGDITSARVQTIFGTIRRIVVFLLGVVIIVAGLNDPESQNTISMLIIGMVMVGILPVDNLLPWSNREPGGRRRRIRRDDTPPQDGLSR